MIVAFMQRLIQQLRSDPKLVSQQLDCSPACATHAHPIDLVGLQVHRSGLTPRRLPALVEKVAHRLPAPCWLPRTHTLALTQNPAVAVEALLRLASSPLIDE